MRLFTQINARFPAPIDTRFSVENAAGLVSMAASGLAYKYMKVVNLDDGKTYELQSDMVTWKVFESKGPKGDTGPAITEGTVSLVSGSTPNLEITINSVTGKLDFKLTLPPYILGEESPELHTTDKTLIGAINEIYDSLHS